MKVRRPALRYHGGKWQLREWILSHFPPHRSYVESHGGAASPLLAKERAYCEIYNDVDDDVVNFFRVLRDPESASRLAELLALTPFARSELRAAYEPSDDPIERARRTAVRSQFGFGSDSCGVNRRTGFRSRRSLDGTTPALDWARFPGEIAAFAQRLRGVLIDSRDARLVCAEHDAVDTLHYVDPPYVRSTRSEARGYLHEMTDGDHVSLSDTLRSLAGMVVVSGYRCELYDTLYGDWRRADRDVIVFRAKRRVESLWLNDAAVAALETEVVA